MKLFAAILAGGSGTRFWPASTRAVPKQMLPLTGGEPLLRETFLRLDGLVDPARVAIVTAARHANAVRELLPELPPENVLGEPRPRNTAAACALAAHWARRQDPDATLLTLPSDHVVEPKEDHRSVLAAEAARADATGNLLTLGLTPVRPAVEYGWIRVGEHVATEGGHAIHRVDAFVEKPDLETAELYLAQGGHLWHLGMFAWRVDVVLEEFERHLPQVAGPLAGAAQSLGSAGQQQALEEAFDACSSISVDYGILERSERVECIPCSFRWDDLGSFAAVARHLTAGGDGIVSVGDIVCLDAKDCTTWAEDGRLVALLGVRDLIVVHAHGVTLVAPRSRAEDVRKLVDRLPDFDLGRFA